MPDGVLPTISGATDSMINPGSNPTALSKSSGGYVGIGIIKAAKPFLLRICFIKEKTLPNILST